MERKYRRCCGIDVNKKSVCLAFFGLPGVDHSEYRGGDEGFWSRPGICPLVLFLAALPGVARPWQARMCPTRIGSDTIPECS